MKAELEQKVKKFEPITIKLTLENEEDLAYLYRLVGSGGCREINGEMYEHPNTPEVKTIEPVCKSLWPLLKKLASDMGW